ncbi:LAETG motif-containing sortase-dependent surface protein [Kitasatospora sp. NPDC059327]|uniref:LAETG motif-containing sortase-dependent surface protein n=1 Tax=Kitasatospora sp. NPDC059327 TaxID=3346803 RepID=UPI0036B1E183
MTVRSSRLLAASTLLALSLGATVCAATAGAVGVSPSPTASSTPSAPPTSPAASPSTPPASGTPSAGTSPSGTPSAPATTRPTNLPTPPLPTPAGGACTSHRTIELKTTGSGLANTTLVKGGAAQELTATFENTSGVDLQKAETSFFLTDISEVEPVVNPVTWGKDAFTVQVKLPGGDWKNPESGSVKADDSHLMIDLGTQKIAKGAKLTLQVRLAATGKAVTARYFAQLAVASETFEGKNVPGAPADSCVQFSGSHRVDDLFKVADTAAAATTPAATGSAKASASPAAGPHLAETGSSSNTLPIALGGAAVLAAGAGTLIALRRRKAGSHG